MKIGLFYEDKHTGELFMCDNFTYSIYVWVSSKGKRINEDKTDAWKHMNPIACKDKQRIKSYLDKLDFTVRGFCYTCDTSSYSKFVKYIKESASGDRCCPTCNTELKYY